MADETKHDLPTGISDFGNCDDMFVPIEKIHSEIVELSNITGVACNNIKRSIYSELSAKIDKDLADLTGLRDPATVTKLRAELNTALKCYEAEKKISNEYGMVAEARRALFGNPRSPKKHPGLLFLAKEMQRIFSTLPQRGWDWIYDEDGLEVVADIKRLLTAPEGEPSQLVALLEQAYSHSEKIEKTPPDAAKHGLADRVVIALSRCGIHVTKGHQDYYRGEGIGSATKELSQVDNPSIKVLRYLLKISGEHVKDNARLDIYLHPAINRFRAKNKST